MSEWRRANSQGEWVADRTEEAADIALGSARIAKQAATTILDRLPPPPDPRDSVDFQRLAGVEQTFLARLSPRRNRWPELVRFDERIAELDRRDEEVQAPLRQERAVMEDLKPDQAVAPRATRVIRRTRPRPFRVSAIYLARGSNLPGRPLVEPRQVLFSLVCELWHQ